MIRSKTNAQAEACTLSGIRLLCRPLRPAEPSWTTTPRDYYLLPLFSVYNRQRIEERDPYPRAKFHQIPLYLIRATTISGSKSRAFSPKRTVLGDRRRCSVRVRKPRLWQFRPCMTAALRRASSSFYSERGGGFHWSSWKANVPLQRLPFRFNVVLSLLPLCPYSDKFFGNVWQSAASTG